MKLIDTNGLDFMVKQRIAASGNLYITPDIQDEFEAWHDRKPPRNVENLFETSWFDRGAYLDGYKKMLNSYGGRSFYNMGGFGDISLLATLQAQRVSASRMLPGLAEEIEVITGDEKLTRKIEREFGKAIKVSTPSDFFN